MIGRTEAIGQVGSASLDCWVQLTLPQVACWLWVDCFDFTGKLVFAVQVAIEIKDTPMPFSYKSRSKLRTRHRDLFDFQALCPGIQSDLSLVYCVMFTNCLQTCIHEAAASYLQVCRQRVRRILSEGSDGQKLESPHLHSASEAKVCHYRNAG